MSLPGPYSPARPPVDSGRVARFDGIVLDCAERLQRHLGALLDGVEFAVEDVPSTLPADATELALSTRLPAETGGSTRVVVYRRPVELRVQGRADTIDLVTDLLVAELAELLGRDADDLDPRGR
jgi:predicted Zn-dependent protease with MMP-like domain